MASELAPFSFAAALRRRRLEARLTQEALAERAGMSARGIQNLEGGVTRPYRDSARRLVRALDLAGADEAAFLAAAQRAPRGSNGLVALDGSRNRHNLPAPLTSFVGRERDIAELRERLSSTRLLTLTGAGGVGKTRLALEVAGGALGHYPDGVWLAELAGLADPGLVPQAVAAAVGVHALTGRDLPSALVAALRPKRLLLLLDNCEHLLDACAALADALLRACPGLTILATSRPALGTAGEVAWRVPPLAAPDPAALPPLDALAGCEAVRLFVERAAAARPGFALTARNAPAVAQICTRLDGLPLALELAAARVMALSPDEIARRLGDRFRLLGGGRAGLPRQRTLRATLDWSYDLLSAPERALFARLAVFAGGWALEAAEAVGAGDGLAGADVLDALCRLVDQSLVAAEDRADGATRYHLPETIRDYAAEQLAGSGEAEAARARHAAYYLELAVDAAAQADGPRAAERFDRLEAEDSNLRATLTFFVARDLAEPALRLVGALGAFWHARGHRAGERELLAAALALPGAEGPTAARALALRGAFGAAYHQGDNSLARRWGEELLAIARCLGDRAGEAESLDMLGLLARNRGEFAIAQQLYEQALALQQTVGDRREIATLLDRLGENALYQGGARAARPLLEQGLAIRRELGDDWGLGWSLSSVGWAAWALGERAEARAHFEAALALHRSIGYPSGAAYVLHALGALDLEGGDLASARARLAEALAVATGTGETIVIVLCLGDCAALAAARGEPARALRLVGAVAAQRAMMPDALTPQERATVEGAERAARAAMGDVAAEVALAEGRAMPLDEAVAYALADHAAW